MDDDGGLGTRGWGYYEQPLKSNLGLQLMSTMPAERDTKPLLSNGVFLHRDCGIAEPSIPMEFMRDGWMHMQHRDKMLQMLPGNNHHHHHHHHRHDYPILPEEPVSHTFQMLQQPEVPKEEKLLHVDDPSGIKEPSSKKKSQGRSNKAPKPRKSKKAPVSKDEANNESSSRGRVVRKCTEVIINGIDLDISKIPTPVCTCTGVPQPCYRWGVGGWQSACCTTNISMHPLPMSTKRRGSRIAGRKMSQGAFKKVLEKLAGEGYNLSNPIDLRSHWAKHGTNKFVTIR